MVSKAIRSPEVGRASVVQPLPKLGPFQARLYALLEKGEARPRREELRLTRTRSAREFRCPQLANWNATIAQQHLPARVLLQRRGEQRRCARQSFRRSRRQLLHDAHLPSSCLLG